MIAHSLENGEIGTIRKVYVSTHTTHPEFHPETRSKSCGDHLQGKFTEKIEKISLADGQP